MGTGYINVDQVSKFLSVKHSLTIVSLINECTYYQLLNGVLSIKVYGKEHRLQSLIDSTNYIDNDMSHLITVPISESKLNTEYGINNIAGEKLFNLYELNKRLSTIDRQIIKQKKRHYAEVYQVNTVKGQEKKKLTR